MTKYCKLGDYKGMNSKRNNVMEPEAILEDTNSALTTVSIGQSYLNVLDSYVLYIEEVRKANEEFETQPLLEDTTLLDTTDDIDQIIQFYSNLEESYKRMTEELKAKRSLNNVKGAIQYPPEAAQTILEDSTLSVTTDDSTQITIEELKAKRSLNNVKDAIQYPPPEAAQTILEDSTLAVTTDNTQITIEELNAKRSLNNVKDAIQYPPEAAQTVLEDTALAVTTDDIDQIIQFDSNSEEAYKRTIEELEAKRSLNNVKDAAIQYPREAVGLRRRRKN